MIVRFQTSHGQEELTDYSEKALGKQNPLVEINQQNLFYLTELSYSRLAVSNSSKICGRGGL
jgi:hypothetical protein